MKRIHWTDWALALGVGALALGAYGSTLTPSLSYLSPDGSELATVPYILGLAHPPGYPLYTWLGFFFTHLIPCRDVAWRMNLLSAVGAAWGVALAYLIARLLLPPAATRRELWLQRGFALAGAAALAFSPTLWSQATIAEVYAPNLALLNMAVLLLLLWARRPTLLRYAAFALAFGLSLGTHLSNLGFAPAFVLFTALVLAQQGVSPRRWVATALVGGGAFALGAAQFLWIPLRAASLPPALLLSREAPTTLAGLYRYTLGAFANLRFAFPLAALPDRIVLYLYYLKAQFGLGGMLLGTVGMLAMPFLRPRRFLLLAGMYLAHLAFFLAYRAFDLEVFFIPVHAVWAWWMAFGWYGIFYLLRKGTAALGWRPSPFIRDLGVVLLSGLLLAQGLVPFSTHWDERNLSQDTAVDDFYAAVWQVLPPNATLLSPRGVFGYDVFYWRLVYHTRPDVHLPALEDPSPAPLTARQGALFATATALQRRRAPEAASLDRFWAVPVVLGEQPEGRLGARATPLVLLALQSTPPAWQVSAVPEDVPRIESRFRGVTLVAARLTPQRVESGGLVHLTLYWCLDDPQRALSRPLRLTLRLGGRSLAQYTLGFGLLSRYAQEVGLQAGDVLAIDYGVVVPSTFEEVYGASLQLVVNTGAVVPLGQVDVVDQQSPWAYWLAVARGER